MESISHDSELMTQYVAAKPFNNSNRFIAVRDEANRLMLFSIGTDSEIWVSKIGSSGQRELHNFGIMLGFGTYKAQALDVAQDPSSGVLYIALATERNASESTVSLLRPFHPKDRDLSSAATKLGDLIMTENSPAYNRVYSISMVGTAADSVYPPTLLQYQTTVHESHDLASIAVKKENGSYSWDRETDVQLPENASNILAIQPMVAKLGDHTLPGYATLYVLQGETQLIFQTVNVQHKYSKTLKCPPGAQSLSTVISSDGFSDLLIGGTGLYRYHADLQQITEKTEADLISQEGVFGSVKYLSVTQSGENLSVWATNTADGVGYIQTTREFTGSKLAVPVIPDGQGGYFTPFKATSTDVEKFVFADSNGQLSMLEQDQESGIWNRCPLITPALKEVFPVQGYVSQIALLGPDKLPVASERAILRSSGDVSVIANGRPVLATPAGVEVRSDEGGLVTITVPTQDVSTYTFTVSNVASATDDSPTLSGFDPSDKVFGKLANVKSSDDLKKTGLVSGVPDDDLDNVVSVLQAAVQRRGEVLTASPTQPNADNETYSAELAAMGIQEMFWSAWHWLERQAKSIEHFWIEGKAFVVKIAGQAYAWVLNTVTEIGKAIGWLFNKILKLGEEVLKWLGYIFQWDDIVATKDSIINIANDSLDKGSEKAQEMKASLDKFCSQTKETLSKDRPEDKVLDDDKAIVNDTNANYESAKSEPVRSVKANWATYQLRHGGAGNASVIHNFEDEEMDALYTKEIQEWEKELPKFAKDQEKPIANTETNVVKAHEHGSSKTKDVLKKVEVSLLEGIISGMQSLGGLLLDKTAEWINILKALLNKPITIPVFSALYKKLPGNGNKDFTLLEGISFILAIPTTVISKIITGDAPPVYKSGDFSKILDHVKFPTTLDEDGEPVEIKSPQTDDDKPSHTFNYFANILSLVLRGIGLVMNPPSEISSFEADSESDGKPMIFPPPAQPLIQQARRIGEQEKGLRVDTTFYRSVYTVIHNCFSVPTEDTRPGHSLKILSWAIALMGNTIDLGILVINRFEAALSKFMGAVLKAVVESIIYALEVAVRAQEIVTLYWTDKDDLWSYLDCVSLSCDLLKTYATSGETLIKGKFF
ncbi:hypothetical protein P168DRAFT_325235 [Aspergillus campestris IBT 28561]|uniref:Uncharacterized protein n=1 Tax=Aspergillus campestris (strain IBT 28561) TaxID=1392248 RepID=A0A2I1D904_ASPC2|nr:uncharacterized protein P168DRAFT_325235 [Aspergillus campestris IBT 28561]PKY06356.1 hypothetical protein P168DRAFT_325235 [Aspergillus campestris IBT 28561]